MDCCWSWSSNTLATWCKDPTHWKRPWCWARLRAEGEVGDLKIYTYIGFVYTYQFSSVTQSCPILCDSMDCSTPGFPVHHQLLELAQTHVHWVSDAIQPSHPLSSPSSLAFNLYQHQGLFQWISSSQQVAKLLEFQLQHQSRSEEHTSELQSP